MRLRPARSPGYTVQAIEALRARLVAAGGQLDAALVSALAYGGMRPREALALRWDDVSPDAILIRASGDGSRLPGADRTVRLLAPLAADLDDLRLQSDGAYVFGDRAGNRRDGDWWRRWEVDVYQRAAAQCIPKPCPTGLLRFVFSTLMLREGLSMAAVADATGDPQDALAALYGGDLLPAEGDARESAADAIARARANAVAQLWPNRLIERFVDDGKVIEGKDGWLFVAYDDSTRVLDQHLGRLRLSPEELAQWTQTLDHRAAELRERDVPSLFLIAPNTHSVHPEKLPAGLPLSEARPVRQLLGALEEAGSAAEVLYPLDELRAAAAVRPVCFTVDSHWNDWGAFVAYGMIVDSLAAQGVPARRLAADAMRFVEKPTPGTLGTKMTVEPRLQLFADLPLSARLMSDNRVLNRGERLVLECGEAPPVTCLLFGDSYARSLVRFMAETFGRLVFTFTTSLDPEQLENASPDVVVSVLAERYLITPPDDRLNRSLREWEALKRSNGALRPRLTVWDADPDETGTERR